MCEVVLNYVEFGAIARCVELRSRAVVASFNVVSRSAILCL